MMNDMKLAPDDLPGYYRALAATEAEDVRCLHNLDRLDESALRELCWRLMAQNKIPQMMRWPVSNAAYLDSDATQTLDNVASALTFLGDVLGQGIEWSDKSEYGIFIILKSIANALWQQQNYQGAAHGRALELIRAGVVRQVKA